MDGVRFDLWTRRRFGHLAAGWVAALIGSAAIEEIAARKRRKKQKKRRRRFCRTLREACGSAAEEQCCNDLVCDDNTCVGDPVCLRTEGGSCKDRCDCRLGLECSERARNTCRQCALLQTPCDSHDDCCLLSAACGSTIFSSGVCCQQPGAACGLDSDCCANTGKCGLDGCGGVAPVCCRGVGSQCQSSCECCDPLRCFDGTCQ